VVLESLHAYGRTDGQIDGQADSYGELLGECLQTFVKNKSDVIEVKYHTAVKHKAVVLIIHQV
jgi:hypothetical protein